MLQIHVNGLIGGAALALVALAFQLVYLPTRIFFISLAGLYTLTPYVYLAAGAITSSDFLRGVAAIAVSVGLSLVFDAANHAPLKRRQAASGAHLISSLGLYIVVIQVIGIVWGQNIQNIRTGLDSTVAAASVILTHSQLLTVGIAGGLSLATLAALFGTGLGLRLRALAENPSQFAMFGYDARLYQRGVFGLSAGLVAVASLLSARDVGFSPASGMQAVLLAVVAVIVGGRGSFAGPVIAALLLGWLRAGVAWHLSARWQDVVTYALLALFLLLRPQGIAWRPLRVEATSA